MLIKTYVVVVKLYLTSLYLRCVNYLRQRRRYMFLPVFVCLSVYLSVSKITQKRVDIFG